MDSPYSVLTRISYTGVHRIPFTRIGSFFQIANVVTRIRVDGVPTVFLPGFRTLGSTGP